MAAKFHIKLKLQGLELEVDGTRDDLPGIRQALTDQIAGLLTPATELAAAEPSPALKVINGTRAAVGATSAEPAKKVRRKARVGAAATPAEGAEAALDWRHDTEKFGNPLQAWKNSDKAIWLLYVASKAVNAPEMSNGQIVNTFTKHFRHAGLIRGSNLSRDLARLKVAKNGKMAMVSEDTTKNPAMWFLTATGIAHAESLVAAALGQASQA